MKRHFARLRERIPRAVVANIVSAEAGELYEQHITKLYSEQKAEIKPIEEGDPVR